MAKKKGKKKDKTQASEANALTTVALAQNKLEELLEFKPPPLTDGQHGSAPKNWERWVQLACALLHQEFEYALVLAYDADSKVYLIVSQPPEPNDSDSDGEADAWPANRIEYQVSDGMPGSRSHSQDFLTYREALECFHRVARLGWRRYTDRSEE